MSLFQDPANQTLAQNGYSGPSTVPQVTPTGQNIATGINTSGAVPFTSAQLGLLGQLQAQANGTGGPTTAQSQLQSGTNAALGSALAASASSTRMGQNPGDAARQAGLAQTNAIGNAALNAAQIRAQQMQSAQGQAGNLATAGAGQQLQEAQAQEAATQAGQEFGATQGQQANEFNVGTQAAENAQYNAALTGLTNLNQGSQNALTNAWMSPQTIGGIASAAGSGLGSSSSLGSLFTAISDSSVKTAIDAENASANAFLNALSKYSGVPAIPATPTVPSFTNNSKPTQSQNGTTQSASQLASANAGSLSPMGTAPVDPTTTSLTEPTLTPQDEDYGLSPGELTSDEDSKKHIDQLTDVLQTAVEGKANANPELVPFNPSQQQLQAMAPAPINTVRTAPFAYGQGPTQEQFQQVQPFIPRNTTTYLGNGNQPNITSDNDTISVQPATSDENEKENIDLDKMKMHSYEYKDPSMPGAAPGTHWGPMAQEIEKAGPIGESVVVEGADGVKRVDTGRLALALAGAMGTQQKRLNALESALAFRNKKD